MMSSMLPFTLTSYPECIDAYEAISRWFQFPEAREGIWKRNRVLSRAEDDFNIVKT